jgi:arylsulfatase A-like enzyme
MTRNLQAHHRLAASALLVWLALATAGCGRTDSPRWIPLARGFVPASGAELERAWSEVGPLTVRAGDGRTLTVRVRLPARAWQAQEGSAELHEWSFPCALLRTLRDSRTEGIELELGGTRVPVASDRASAEQQAKTGAAAYVHGGQRLVLLRADPAPPGPGSLACRVQRGWERDGAWRAALQELVADGLSIWPGESWETRVAAAPGSALRFSTVARTLGREGRVVFRVTCDGATLLEHEEELGETGLGTWHELPLPGAGSLRLVFEVRGDPGLTAFVQPTIGPREVGSPAERPWPDARPNVVLFLADTFRADLLAAGGGRAGTTPHLDRIAERSLCFPRARSTATWTLPAHVSLFTGLFPTQHGALNEGRTFSPALVTLAELLARAGYRTGAVTDAGFVSSHYGLDRGFELFLEHNEALGHKLAKTLRAAREFLARDDGRPAFLFVHTYRTHWPYRTGSEEDRRAHDALVEPFSAALEPGARPEPAVLARFGAELAALYRQGASALDAEVGPWFDELERAGFFRPGYFVFTSDHGEAFFEHGKSEHRGMPYEEELRVPLFLFGPGLAARSSPVAASLVDLAPTLAELCGLQTETAWCGRSLLAPTDELLREQLQERLLFAWQGAPDKETLAIVSGERKLFVPAHLEVLERGEVKAAFELALDPGEHRNVVKQGATWPAELARSAVPGFEPLSRPLAESTELEISTWLREELARLGYAGQ